MRLLKYLLLLLILSFFACTGILYADEVTPSGPPVTETKAPEGKIPEKAADQAVVAPGKEAPKAEAPKEEPPAFTASTSVAFLNRYIFRGYRIGESGLVIQPSVSASYKGFTFTYWGNFDTHQKNTVSATFASEGQAGYNETDLTLSYTYGIDKLSLTGGYIHYDLRYANSTDELFLTFAYDILTKPTLSIYQDVNAYPGTYINLSLAHSFALPKDITLDLGASIGYECGQGRYWQTYQPVTATYTGPRYHGFHDGMVKVGFTIPVTKAFLVQPVFQYYFPLSSDSNKTYGTDPTTDLRVSYNPNGYLTSSQVYGVNFVYNF